MRIVIVTAGTGSFHCGTCMRDNALARALRDLGHDAILVPLYLPLTLDEPAAAEEGALFYGAINVYLQQTTSIFRKTPRWVDRVFDSPTMLNVAAKRVGTTQAEDLGDLTLSTLRGQEGNQTKELDRLVDWLQSDFQPDVVCLSNGLLIGLAQQIRKRTGARVYCTLQGEHSFLDSLKEPHRSQAWQLLGDRAKDLNGLIAVSRYHAELMASRAGLRRDHLHVVHNGIRLDGFDMRDAAPSQPAIGYMARMSKAKGLDTLVDAFIHLRQQHDAPHAKLMVAGSMIGADEPFVAELKARLTVAGLGNDAEFYPNVSRDEKISFLQRLTVLSVPATYGESFGLYLIEAWAAGVPVVQPRHAAFPELIEPVGGGLLYEPDDCTSLADALSGLLADPSRATEMGRLGRNAVEERFTAEKMARDVEAVFQLGK